MKLVLALVVLVFLVGSFVADYKWRKWVRERRHDRE
jgi:hypothetical protein